MPITLYADFVSPDGSISMANTHVNFGYNLLVLESHGIGKNAPIFSAGKYICMVIVDEVNKPHLFMMDYRKNPSSIQDFLDSSEPDASVKQKFISLVELVNSQYEQVKDKIIVVQGKAPAESDSGEDWYRNA